MDTGEHRSPKKAPDIAAPPLPDIFLVSDRETLEELVENDLIEDLTEVYKSCASDKIKEMYESYGEELLASGTFDGKLYALPETAIDDGPQLLWLRRDWMEQLGLKEPKTLEEAFSVIRAFQENRMGAEDGEDPVGLVCDPVAGLVEVPCVKRNVGGAVNALAAADMALAGIISQIPVDQVIDAMGEVGMKMDVSLRETSMGGVATSPKGLEIAERLGM